jgi:hypothetical protein
MVDGPQARNTIFKVTSAIEHMLNANVNSVIAQIRKQFV